MRTIFLLFLILNFSKLSISQKVDKCKFQEYSFVINDTILSNKLLGVSYDFGHQFHPVRFRESNSILHHTNIDVMKSDSGSLVPIDYSKKKRYAIIYQVQEKQFDSIMKQVHFTISKNFITGLNEDVHLNSYLNELNELGIYKIYKKGNNSIYAHRASDGLWWYYVKYSLKENLDRVSYTIIKNYNSHLAMVFYLDNLETKEEIADYIENISVWNWNDDLKLKKSINDCN